MKIIGSLVSLAAACALIAALVGSHTSTQTTNCDPSLVSCTTTTSGY